MKKKTKETTDAKAFAHKSIEVAAHQLRPAPWNPRPEITSESVADITASLPKVGLIHPLVVMKDPDKPSCKGVDFYVIISGHRRFRACVDAKYYPIPCDLVDVDVATAKQMTIIENLQRRDADPLLESELVKSLIDGGMTQAEIAAETGRGERWVARRANLCRLSKSWRKRVKKGEQFTVDCLEHIAAYPEEIQEKCKDATGGYYSSGGTALTWSEFRWQFQRESRDLRKVVFDTEKCLHCTNNTGCCPDLFDDGGGKLGKCLDPKCFATRTEEAIDATVAKAEKKGRTVVRGKQPYQCGVYGTTKKPTKINTALYVYTDSNGAKVMEYAAPPPRKDVEAEQKVKAARREVKRREKLIDAARTEAQEKFDEWFSEREADGKWPKWIIEKALEDFYAHAEDVVDTWASKNGFTASDVEADKAYKEHLAKTCGSAADGEDEEQDDGLAGIYETGLPGEPEP